MSTGLAHLHDEAEQNFTAALRGLLDARGYTQGSFADGLQRAGLRWTQTTVSRVLAGSRGVSLGEAVTVAKVLGTSLELMVQGGEAATRRARFFALVEELESLLDEQARTCDEVTRARGELEDLLRSPDFAALLNASESSRASGVLERTRKVFG